MNTDQPLALDHLACVIEVRAVVDPHLGAELGVRVAVYTGHCHQLCLQKPVHHFIYYLTILLL